MHTKARLEGALSLLGEFLGERVPKESLIISGGAALSIKGIVSRTTKDVDVVALLGENEILDARPLPTAILDASRLVAQALGLNGDWLNDGSAAQIKFGFPEGFQERLEMRRYGKSFTVYFIGRLDQIHFKLFAAVDQGPGKHSQDLLALMPTKDEMDLAAFWVRDQDASAGFKTQLKEALAGLGYAESADRI